MTKTALIIGITGQDGSYLAELLLEKGYFVHGTKRRSSSLNTERIDHLFDCPNLKLHYSDLSDAVSLMNLMSSIRPDEIYNLGAQSHVQVSFDAPEYTGNVTGLGTLRLLEAARILNREKPVRFYQASTSELYGLVRETPQTESTPFYPRSPYSVAKLYSHWATINYREAYGLFACAGILFNHESPRRGETFVSRKIAMGLAAVATGSKPCLYLGNLDAIRDWGHAADYVYAMWLMLQQPEPDEYVIATGRGETVRSFAEHAAAYFDMKIEWQGSGDQEVGIDSHSGRQIIAIDPRYYRPTEVDVLIGDAARARRALGWEPKYSFEELVEEMCLSEKAKAGL
ncbi:MAG: GDP-mannose 4,6-dehydratase [Gammaproteobacteria bacterium]